MTPPLRLLLALGAAAAAAGCQNPAPPPAASTPASEIRVDGKTLAFQRPGTGDTFTLHLGDALDHDTGGTTEVPRHVRDASRDPTSSYYEPKDKDGGGYTAAESLYTRDQADLVASNTSIQSLPDSGRLLIREDKSDGRPCVRYILYTARHTGGYRVTYLDPGYNKPAGRDRLYWTPAGIRLLPGDRAEINGKVVRIDEIAQSPHPFSLGL